MIQKQIEVCGARSPNIQNSFSVICTNEPNHKGDHRTIYSVDTLTGKGFEYTWPQEEC
jgi:hypothetical protein